MGHASVNLTAKTYRHLYPETLTLAAEKVNAYLAAPRINAADPFA